MDVFEAVDSRIACRAFFDKPVDLNIVKDLIVKAQRAASGGNLQSWNVYALTGKPLAEFKAIVKKRIANEDPRHTKSEYPIYPEPMFGAYKERREAHGVQLYGSLGIDRNDAEGRLGQYKKNFEFFGAPVALFITIDRRLGPGQWADLGGYTCSKKVLESEAFRKATPYNEAFYQTMFMVKDFWAVPEYAELLTQINNHVYPYVVSGEGGSASRTTRSAAPSP